MKQKLTVTALFAAICSIVSAQISPENYTAMHSDSSWHFTFDYDTPKMPKDGSSSRMEQCSRHIGSMTPEVSDMAAITSFDDLPLVLHVKDLAEILSISQNTAYALVRSGQIRSIRTGRTYRIPKDALIEYMNKT